MSKAKKKKNGKPRKYVVSRLRDKAYTQNHEVLTAKTLPAPRVEIINRGNDRKPMFQARLVGPDGERVGPWGHPFSRLNNCRRDVLHANLGLPIFSPNVLQAVKRGSTMKERPVAAEKPAPVKAKVVAKPKATLRSALGKLGKKKR